MHFGENQLSPSLIGLSPLTTGHPPCFQPGWVRPSTGSSPRFSLPMASSLGFGSTACEYLALRGGPRRFTPAFPDPALLGKSNRSPIHFAYGAVTLFGASFLDASTM